MTPGTGDFVRVDTAAIVCPRCGLRRDQHEGWIWYPMMFGPCRFQIDHDPGDEDRRRIIRDKYQAADVARTLPRRLADLILDEWWGPRATYDGGDPASMALRHDNDDPRGYSVTGPNGAHRFSVSYGPYWNEDSE